MSSEAIGEPLVDLAAKRLGGMVLAASDEFFAPKERLLEPAPAVFEPGRYTDRGKWMDGWETRRRRGPGDDWALIRLGLPGMVRTLVVDTAHFRGNHPASCSVDGLATDPDADPARLVGQPADWVELLPHMPLEPDREHRFTVRAPLRVTHLRLRIHPDGGVARLRVLGQPLPDLRHLAGAGGRLDLAATANGAEVVACNDMTFGSVRNMLLPGDAVDMGDGWETRRRRGPGHDWAVVRLAAQGTIERVEIGTTHYKGNYPDRCLLEACSDPGAGLGDPGERPEGGWWAVVPSTPLHPHRQHVFAAPAGAGREATHVRLSIYPDGGISRLRVFGQVSERGWERWGLRWLNALPAEQAEAELLACCGSPAWAASMAAARPFADAASLATTADQIWDALGPDDWLEAFAAHPRIGERRDSSPDSADAPGPDSGGPSGSAAGPAEQAPGPSTAGPGAAWSNAEQAGVGGADPGVLAALAEGNLAYERRFGHVFLISASGRGADELLAALHRRLDNDPEAELGVAAAEQRTITRLRLGKLLRP
jgi:allantoicase